MAILNLGNNDAAFSGSFSGSFQGDGNSLTNISSTSLNGIGIGLSTIVGDAASSATSYGNAFGKSATSTGGSNVAIGAFSNVKQYGISIGHSVAGGNNTVAVGYNAGHTSGENNVLVGYQPGTNTSGDYNISLGYLAGHSQTTGDGNITIGSGSVGLAGESNQLRIGHGLHGALISGSLSDGGIMIRGQVSASSYIGDGSGLTNLPAASAGSTSGRVVFTTTNGELTSEAGFTYDATTNRLTVPNLTTTTFTSSFITSSQIHTSGSNIFGDDTTDTQTLIGTTLMTGSAQISGSLTFGGTAPTDLYTGGPKRAIDTSAVGGIKAKGALFLQASADSSYNSRILFGTNNAYMSFGRRGDNSTAIRGVTQNYAWQLFGITQGLIGSTYTTNLPDTTFADNLTISGSGTYMSEPLKVHGSGSSVFEVIGTEGTLFSVDDDLDGTLLNVKDRSGIPVLQASASGEIYLGQSPQSLYTTAVISSTTADVTQSLYGLDTSSYGGAFFDYIAHSGSNARGGTVSSVWTPGGSVVFSETTTTHIGDTSNLNLVVHFSQSQAQLAYYADTSQYNIKVITRAI